MSFRGDDQSRYGQIPPVQYPIGNQQQQQQQQQQYGTPLPPQSQYDQSHYPVRRPSFNDGDDNSYFNQGRHAQPAPAHQLHHAHANLSGRGEEELFLTSPVDGPSSASSAPPLPAKPAAYSGSTANPAAAMSGYQHQYQTQPSPTSYNPQSPQAQQQPSPQSYTPAAYNPAAYASAQSSVPQRTTTYAGYSSYQQPHSYSAPAVPTVTAPPPASHLQHTANPALYTPPAPSQTSPAASSYHPGSYYSSSASAAAASPQPNSYDPAQQQQQQYLSSYSPNNSSYFTPTANNVSPMPSPGAIASTMTSQAPYPSYSQIPSGATYSSGLDTNTFASRVNRSNSNVSAATGPSPSVHSHSPSPAPGLQRHPTNAPLPIRPPMDDLREDRAWAGTPATTSSHDHITQDSLIHDIEADLGITMGGGHAAQNGDPLYFPPTPGNGDVSEDDLYNQPSRTSSTHPSTSGWSSATSAIGRTSSSASTASSAFDHGQAAAAAPSSYRWEDDSDPEGAFGVYEMQQADLDEQRFSISGASTASGMSATTASQYNYSGSQPNQHTQPPPPPHRENSITAIPPTQTSAPLPRLPDEPSGSDSEFVGMDLGLFSGGYAGNLAYGSEVGSADLPPQSITPRPYEVDSNRAPYPRAEVDYGDTGGLQPPALHRLSFDEGDEHVSVHSGMSGSESPSKEEYPDMFYHPGLTNRPLPALPPGLSDGNTRSSGSSTNLLSATPSNASRLSYQQHGYSHSTESRSSAYLSMQEQQQQLMLQQQQYQNQLHVERSTSMLQHSTTPVVHVPGRSRTDAAEERRKAHRQMAAHQGVPYDSSYDGTGTPSSVAYDVITLPTGRRKKFVPSKLSTNDLRRCHEPWALSNIAHWVREMADGEPDLKRKTIEEGLVSLFTAKVPNMNVADAETLATSVADSMFAAGILIPEEEWVKFGPGEISGVLWQLTGSGCYAQRLHAQETPGRCYSYYCTRTLKKANLDDIMSEESTKKEDWVSFYKITKEMMESKNRKEIERQNVLHEIVTSEEEFNSQLDVLRVLYKEQLRHWEPPIIPANRLDKFVKTVFGKVDSMQRVNKDHLLAQLKYRQNEQGPWIAGFSDIFREWIRKAKDEYIAYSTAYPVASFTVRKEAARNMLFRQFLDHVRNHKRSNRLGWDTFLKAPITRLQRYSLLLSVVLKNTIQDSEEKANLARAIEEIRMVTKDCDRLVDEMGKKVSLQELQSQLVFRPGSQTVLNLDHLGRELLLQGDLQRMGTKGVRWVDTHALLFDHYFILTKSVSSKDGRGDKKYDVSKEPIPMPLLLLESMHDDPITKQKGLAAPLARTTAASAPDIRLNKVVSNGATRPDLEHATTSSSASSAARLNPGTPGEEGKTLYPFRVKHLGHEVYTLYATTQQGRDDWCNKIIEAKTRHARALLEQNAEPFRLRVLADSGFAYDSLTANGKQTSVSIRGTPLDRSIREIENVFGPGRGPPPVCRAAVNCSAGFTAFGKSVIAIGTDFGVYISDATNPRGWSRSVQIHKVTQIAVLEEFSVCLVLADKALISYPLDVIAPVSNFAAPTSESPRRAPQRLAKDVSFFAIARMKDRTLMFYKKKEGMHNTFKVLEPVFQKASEKKTRFFGSKRGNSSSGATESFRDFDEFYLPIECYSINLFQTYVAVSTAKGIEMLTLDRKQTMSVPRDLTIPATTNIAARIRDQRPLGMFRLNDQEFLLAYEDCAVYADKHGEVSRTLIMEYSGKQKKARAATMFGQYLLLFNEDYVEVRNAENGRLRQIIAGNDVRCLDYGFRGPTGGDNASATAASNTIGSPTSPVGQVPIGQDSKGTVKIGMTHPEVAGMQIVLELQLNDGHSEKA
ncbi:rho1 guanine nucleotide exchange factor 1 [Ophiostoma piceae UAMH 11346]|uniref:Rho1 guanine nucleotide exchange factor 1 n=1 Tax=Ophiostoma piceae (strain UAMH 11346) TaxID=1262450 RepID=S3C5E3_OPHP1|nr:rho1 guanine nucleotide exchange factor 1 [Ophiostoma piceae UAMH 11346]